MSPPVIDAVAEDPNEARAFRVGLWVIAKRALLALAGLAFVGGLSAAMISRMGGPPPAPAAAAAAPVKLDPLPALFTPPLPPVAAPPAQFVPPPIAGPAKKVTPKKKAAKKSNRKTADRRHNSRPVAALRRKQFKE